MLKSTLFWTLAIALTLVFVVYQRLTGPTHPKRGSIEIEGQKHKYRLIRSYGELGDATIKVKMDDQEVTGILSYKRFKSSDDLTEVAMTRNGEYLQADLPQQPAAGKLAYTVQVEKSGRQYLLTDEPVVIRFTGYVPKYILIPHILFMFVAMLFSTRTGIEALIKGKMTLNYAWVTLIALLIGGMFLGPVVQKFAFDDYWTGWPFGNDLTDNKTLVAVIFWTIAVVRLRKRPDKPVWAIVAAAVLLAVYLIPHSVLGSEFDYEAGEVVTGK